jgi:hypothetical protein
VGERDIHTGCSYGGLVYTQKSDGPISRMFLTDLKRGISKEVDPEKFMDAWRENYNDPEWDYFAQTDPTGLEAEIK